MRYISKQEHVLTRRMPSPGTLLQLVATGKQDVFLTGNPQISFYKVVYRRYTNFSIESCRMYFEGRPDFGQRITCLVPRFGDLLGSLFLVVNLPALTRADNGAPISYVNSIGHSLIEEISLEIGEQEIDKQTGEFMELWTQLSTPAAQQAAFNEMVGRSADPYTAPTFIGPQTLYIPLQFWFCRNPGNYLPLLALQYHPVRINIRLRALQEMAFFPNATPGVCLPTDQVNQVSITSINLWGDYVTLDKEERRRFVSSTHEYLIDQVQYTPKIGIPTDSASSNIKMDFNHPCRELIWTVQRDDMISLHEYFNYSSKYIGEVAPAPLPSGCSAIVPRTDLMLEAKVQLDGQDRFDYREAKYFRLVQPYQRHTANPYNNYIYVYSFALRPEDVQPTGSMNASRIDSFNLLINIDTDFWDNQCIKPIGNLHSVVYATNHNILRVIDGFGGLLFKI